MLKSLPLPAGVGVVVTRDFYAVGWHYAPWPFGDERWNKYKAKTQADYCVVAQSEDFARANPRYRKIDKVTWHTPREWRDGWFYYCESGATFYYLDTQPTPTIELVPPKPTIELVPEQPKPSNG